jgi:hypothetical protein
LISVVKGGTLKKVLLMIDKLTEVIERIINSPSDLNHKDLNLLVDATNNFYNKLKTIKNITKSCDNNTSTEKYTITTIKELLEDFD